MRRKLEKMAAKTGASKKDTSALWKLGFAGVCALAVAVIAGCSGRQTKKEPPPQHPAQAQAAQDEAVKQAQEIKISTSTNRWENYPAGTRYHTVSVRDFAA